MALMGHDGPLLPAYFAEQGPGSLFIPCFLMKIQYTKFRRYVWMNLLINGNFEHINNNTFRRYSHASVTEALK